MASKMTLHPSKQPVTTPPPDSHKDPITEEMLKARKMHYRYAWKTPLALTPCRLKYFMESLFWYLCCYGACPLSGRIWEQRNPNCCLCLEVLCCVGLATMTTRWIIQDQMRLGNTRLDNCLTGTITCIRSCLNYLIWKAPSSTGAQGNLDRQAAMRVVECLLVGLLAGPVVCSLTPCLLTQQYEMLNMRDANPSTIFEPYDASMVAPGLQSMDRMPPAAPSRAERWWGVSRSPEKRAIPQGNIPEHLSTKANPPVTVGGPPPGWPNTHRMHPPTTLSPQGSNQSPEE